MTKLNPRYIINADDFGMSGPVNDGITQAFAEGLISSATMIANLPGFEQAASLAQAHSLQGKLGVHLNLTEGPPLTQDILACPRFASANQFAFRLPRSSLRVTSREAASIHAEWDAQIRRVKSCGIEPSHLDSHHHVHTVWPLLTIAMKLAKQHGIAFVRLSRTTGPSPGLSKSIMKAAINQRLRAAGLAGTDYFGSAGSFLDSRGTLHGVIEVMVHPRIDNGVLIDVTGAVPSIALSQAVGQLGIKEPLLSFTEVASARGRGR